MNAQREYNRFLRFLQSRCGMLLSLSIILLCGFLLKIAGLFLEPTLSRDGALYVQLIKIWSDSNDFNALLQYWEGYWIPPFFLYLAKCLMYFGLTAAQAGIGINLVLGTFAPLIGFGIAFEVTRNRIIALCSALLLAMHPALNELSVQVQRDMIFLFLSGSAVWSICAGIRRKKWYFWILGGLLLSMSFLTRYETAEFLLLTAVALTILVCTKYLTVRQYFLYGFCTLATFLASASLLCHIMGTDNADEIYRTYFEQKAMKAKQQYSNQEEEEQQP